MLRSSSLGTRRSSEESGRSRGGISFCSKIGVRGRGARPRLLPVTHTAVRKLLQQHTVQQEIYQQQEQQLQSLLDIKDEYQMNC